MKWLINWLVPDYFPNLEYITELEEGSTMRYNTIIEYVEIIANLKQRGREKAEVSMQQNTQIQRLTNMLADKYVLTTVLQKVSVRDHCISRYRERCEPKLRKQLGSDEDMKKMIFKCMANHIAQTGSLPDGEYETVHKNMRVRVENHIVKTAMARRGSK